MVDIIISAGTAKVKARTYKVGATYFMDYSFPYNPWKIWSEHLQKAVKSDMERLQSEEYRKSIGSFHDEKFFYNKIHNRMYGTLIVAIYSEIEDCIKRIFSLDNYKYECLQCKLKQYSIDASDLPYFNEMNILRLQVNAFKHNDMYMTKELAKELKTKKLGIVDYTSINIEETVNQCCHFLFELEKRMDEYNAKSNS